MAEPLETAGPFVPLAERFDRLRAEIEQIVTRGIEHPRCELKRSATISRESLADRLDFVKLIQGVANADIAEEKFIVIGADQRERGFYDVPNAAEFDPAKLAAVLSKYLYPQPRIEVFNNMRSESDARYVLIVLSQDQPCPIVTVSEGTSETPEKRTHFRLGDIWIKRDTSLQLAARPDLDKMYERRINQQAEERARQRFKHFREEFGTEFVAPLAISIPSRGLLAGTRKDIRSFAESAISAADVGRFKMQIEMARERLIDEWDSHEVNGPGIPENVDAFVGEIDEFYRDGFIPTLESLVELGLQVIKYDAPDLWLGLIVNTLIDTFETSRRLDRLRPGLPGATRAVLPFTRPAYEAYVGVRTLATYAVARKRLPFLAKILPKLVRYFTLDNLSPVLVPIAFWPFAGSLHLPDMRGGRNRTLWAERIESAWTSYFGTPERFLSAAYQFEFILEFNSYVFEVVKPEGISRLEDPDRKRYFGYEPDFWANSLDDTVPIAELFYDALAAGSSIPAGCAIDERALDLTFKGKAAHDRLLFLGGFLTHLKSWQAGAMLQARRFPFMFDWDGRLKAVSFEHAQSTKAR